MVRKGSLVLILLFSALLPSAAGEEEAVAGPGFAALVPRDTPLFISIPSLKNAWEGFTTLPLYHAYMDEEVQAFITSFGEGMEELAPGVSFGLVKELMNLPEVFDGEVAFALKFPEDSLDHEQWIFSLNATHETERADAFVKKVFSPLLKAFYPWGPVKEVVGGTEVFVYKGAATSCYLFSSKGQVVFSRNREWMEDFLARRGGLAGSLAENETYQEAAFLWEEEKSSFVFYTTLEGIWRRADKEMEKEKRSMLRATGLDGLRYLFACLTMEKGRAMDLIRLEIPGERRGFFRAFTNAPVDPEMVRLAPNNTLLFAGGNLNLGEFYSTLLDMEKAAPMIELQDLRRSADELADKLGLRTFSDVIGLLGTEISLFVALPQGGGLIPEAVLALEVLEPDKLQTNLFGLVETLAGVAPKTVPFKNRQIHYLPITGRDAFELSAAWCLTDGYLLFSFYPAVIKGVIRRLDSGARTLKADPDFQTSWKELPRDAVAVSYANTQRIFNYLYSLILPVTSMVGGELPFEPALLPSGEAISSYLSFGLSGITSHETGVWVRTESDGYGPTSMLLYGLTAAGGIAPFASWRNAHMQYPCCGRTQTNLYERLEEYRQTNGKYPMTLGQAAGVNLGWYTYPCWTAKNLADAASEKMYALDAFGYVVSHKKIDPPETFPEDWMIMWDSEPRHNGGRIICLGNGEVTWMPEEAFQKRLEEQGK